VGGVRGDANDDGSHRPVTAFRRNSPEPYSRAGTCSGTLWDGTQSIGYGLSDFGDSRLSQKREHICREPLRLSLILSTAKTGPRCVGE
jgi:hypothetical protein